MGWLDCVIRSLPQLRYFCCLASLRTGCLVVGWIHLIFDLIMDLVAVLMIMNIEIYRRNREIAYGYMDYEFNEPAIFWKRNLVIAQVLQGVFVLMNSAHAALSVLLLVGVVQKSTRKLKFWLIVQALMIIILTLQTIAIANFENRFDDLDSRILTIQLMAAWGFHSISLYAICIVKSYFEETKEVGEKNRGIPLK